MVSAGRSSLSLQLPWVNYVIVFGSFVSIVTFLVICVFCLNRKSSQNDDVEVEEAVEQKEELPDKRVRRKTPKFPIRLHTSPMQVQPPQQSTTTLSPTDNLYLPHRKISNILGNVQTLTIQPAYEDYMAHECIRAGSVSLPIIIPDAPTDHTENFGRIYFSISYDVFTKLLKILIKKAENLPAMDNFGTSDPYVKIALLPSDPLENKLETRIRKKKLNPTWNESFIFEGFPHDILIGKKLCLQVFDYDRFSRDDEIGEVLLPLGDVPLHSEPVEFVKELCPSKQARGWLGDLLLSMCYEPNHSRWTIIVMKCNKLKAMDITSGTSDPYVKVYLMTAGVRTLKKKTTVKQKCLDPVWNEVIVLEVAFNKIRNVECIFKVMDHNKRLPNKVIGQVVIGPRSSGSSMKHWTDMMNSPRQSIAMWHRIANP